MSNQFPSSDDLQRDDDAGIEQLLREVGSRAEPSRQMADEVRRNVYAEWQAMVDTRLRRRRFIGYGMAASVLGIVAAVTFAWRVSVLASPVTIVRLTGTAEVISDGQRRPLLAGQRITTGDIVVTGSDSRIALDFDDGVTARVDYGSRLAIIGNHRAQLTAGAVYVDAEPNPVRRSELVLSTVYGDVRHVGTQYQVRLRDGAMEVGVREGRIEVTNELGTNAGAAGEQLRLSSNGSVVRVALATDAPDWQWATAIAPIFDIADRSLGDFLSWVARETGRKLTFDSEVAQLAAANVKLRGSIEGLDLDTALSAVLSTTQFRRVKTDDESIRITLVPATESNAVERPTR